MAALAGNASFVIRLSLSLFEFVAAMHVVGAKCTGSTAGLPPLFARSVLYIFSLFEISYLVLSAVVVCLRAVHYCTAIQLLYKSVRYN